MILYNKHILLFFTVGTTNHNTTQLKSDFVEKLCLVGGGGCSLILPKVSADYVLSCCAVPSMSM